MLPVWYYSVQRKVRLGHSLVGLCIAIDYIGDLGLPIEVLEFGAAERGTESGGVLALCGSEKQQVVARNGNIPGHSAHIGEQVE
jgi:hypothetical protein